MNPPANWYPDPTGRHDQRYWDGEQWTEHVFTDGVQGIDPLDQSMTDEADETDAAGEAGEGEPEPEELEHDGSDQGPADQDDPAASEETTDAEDAGGLFADAGSDGAWSPGDEDSPGAGESEGGDAVASDMESEDVVATLDEVAEAPPSADAGDQDTTGEAPLLAGDMSDAFVLAPETASRIVKRRAEALEEAGEPTEEAPEEGSEEASEETPESDSTGEARDDENHEDHQDDQAVQDGASSPGAIDAPPPVAATSLADAPPPEASPETPAPEAAAAEAPAPDAAVAGGGTGTGGGLGITGDLLGGAFAERSEAGPVALQNNRLLRCSVTPGEAVVARQGTMVAYQGDVSFERQGAGGVTRALKRAATGEGLAMMRADGSGDVFFADGAQHVFLLQLAGGPGLSVNGRNVLAFSAALQWDIQRVKGASLLAGGLFNTTFTGNGWVALVSDGEPVVLRTDEAATHVDVNALVAWSAGLSTSIVNSVSAKSLVGLGSGEAFQMAFDGPGIVIVQPSEGPMGGAAAS